MSKKMEAEYQKLERLSVISATKAMEIKKRMDRGEVGNGRFAMFFDDNPKANEHTVVDLEHVAYMDWRVDAEDDDGNTHKGRRLYVRIVASDEFNICESVGEHIWAAYLRYIGAL